MSEALIGNEVSWEGRESSIRYINEQVVSVGSWGSVLLSMSGRHVEHHRVASHNRQGRCGIDPPDSVCNWLKATSRGTDSQALLVCPVSGPSMLLWLEKALSWRDTDALQRETLVMQEDKSQYQHLLHSYPADKEAKTS